MGRLVILGLQQDSLNGSRLQKLASLFGCEASFIEIACGSASDPQLDRIYGELAVAISADALMACCNGRDLGSAVDRLQNENDHLLIFGWRAESAQVEAVRNITNGAISSIESIGNEHRCSIPPESLHRTFQLAGSDYSSEPGESEFAFGVDSAGFEFSSLLARGKLISFLEVKRPAGKLFLNAGLKITDIDEVASRDLGLRNKYNELLPYLIFIRTAFGEASWHGSLQTARLLIDDPLLRRRYGLLEFEGLFRSMESLGYTSTVAFIPWNYQRTSRRNAEYFRAHSNTFSICVHGCDHTGKEFGTGDETLLRQKAELALKRMRKHHSRTGIPFDPVMVFPQGIFSRVAATALRASGFRAAINTTTIPIDNNGVLKIRDLLAPAVSRLYGFPIFVRHYPTTKFEFAFDLYLGRPAFMVEHHQFFKDGLPVLEDLVRDLKQRSPRLQWLSLVDAVAKTQLTRNAGRSKIQVQFFSDKFALENNTEQAIQYSLFKAEPDPDLIQGISVNGVEVPFIRTEGYLSFEAELKPREVASICLRLPCAKTKPISLGMCHTARALVRRRLSEFRDEVLSRHPRLLGIAQRAAGSVLKTDELDIRKRPHKV